MNKQVLFLSNNETLYNYQSVFRKKHPTNSCLTLLHDKNLKGFEKGLITGIIRINLQKTFDTIDNDILLLSLAITFSNHTTDWFKSYLSNRLFRVNLENCYSDLSNITYGVTQGSILGPLLFFIYVNDMPLDVKSNLFLYADDSCLVFQDAVEIKRIFTKIWEWFEDNIFSIHFGKDKTKSILFASKHKIWKVPKLKINYKNIQIKQHSKVTYLDCILDETMSGRSMALKVINKINWRLKS